MFVHVDFITVFPDGVHSQCISRVAGLLAQRALMTKSWQQINYIIVVELKVKSPTNSPLM